jgi:hypothetical protein
MARLDFGGWSVWVTTEKTQIGCQRHDNAAWQRWMPDSPEIVAMHNDASAWWAKYGPAVRAVIAVVMQNSAAENVAPTNPAG